MTLLLNSALRALRFHKLTIFGRLDAIGVRGPVLGISQYPPRGSVLTLNRSLAPTTEGRLALG
jgi:hypothetical protein